MATEIVYGTRVRYTAEYETNNVPIPQWGKQGTVVDLYQFDEDDYETCAALLVCWDGDSDFRRAEFLKDLIPVEEG